MKLNHLFQRENRKFVGWVLRTHPEVVRFEEFVARFDALYKEYQASKYTLDK